VTLSLWTQTWASSLSQGADHPPNFLRPLNFIYLCLWLIKGKVSWDLGVLFAISYEYEIAKKWSSYSSVVDPNTKESEKQQLGLFSHVFIEWKANKMFGVSRPLKWRLFILRSFPIYEYKENV
jgi:hypothetical protein